VGSLNVISGGVTEIGWGTPCTKDIFHQYSTGQYPMTLARCALKMSVSNAVQSMRQNVSAYKTVPSNNCPNGNCDLLLLSGMNCIVWVYISPNVPVVEL
jgi:hypothetical protein